MTQPRNLPPASPAAQGPVREAYPITPNDGADLPNGACRALYVGVTGDLKVTLVDGTTVEHRNLAQGLWHPIACVRVFATGQTGAIATALLAGH